MNELEIITKPDCQVLALMLMPMAGMIFSCLGLIRDFLEGRSDKSDF